MQGLAQSAAQPQQGGVDPAVLEQVIQLLMEGIDPQELINQGVPPEVIMQAVEIIEQQMGGQGGQPASAPPQGLAGSVMV